MNKATRKTPPYCLVAQMTFQAKHNFTRIAEDAYNLTWPQMHTLTMLTPDTPAPMNTISAQLSCDASNVTGIVDRLESRGYIERREMPGDRRVKMVALTSDGVALRQKILDDVQNVVPNWLQTLEVEELQQLQLLLSKALVTKQQH